MEFNGSIITRTADGAVTKYRAVKETGTANGTAEAAQSGAGNRSLGIAVESRATGAADLPVAINGQGLMEVDGSGTPVAANDILKANASGIGVVASSGDEGIFLAAEPSSAAGDVIRGTIVCRKA